MPSPNNPFYTEADFWVALGTVLLACVTAWLALETRKLRRDGAESITAARRSADAAQENSKAALASLKIAEESMLRNSADVNATAILELYAAYANPHYVAACKNAWDLIILCTGSKRYFDFFISTYFATEYRVDGIPEEIVKELRECDNLIHPKRFSTIEELKNWKLQARHDFEDMMNFYNLVNHRIKSTELRDRDERNRYEFYYDWWRPFFWWVSDEISCCYKQMPDQRRRLVSPPKWQDIWQSLDNIYGFQTSNTPQGCWLDFKAHPMVASLGLEEDHKSPACS